MSRNCISLKLQHLSMEITALVEKSNKSYTETMSHNEITMSNIAVNETASNNESSISNDECDDQVDLVSQLHPQSNLHLQGSSSNLPKSRNNTYPGLINNPQSKDAFRLTKVKEALSARVLVLKPNEDIPVNPDPADDSYFKKQGRAHLDDHYVHKKNMDQYHLLQEQKITGRKIVMRLIFKADAQLMSENLFLELFYLMGETVRFRVRHEVETFNKDMFHDLQIMQCDNVPVGVFEKYLQFLNEKKDLLK
ncbi:uncharacterized protein LOC106078018 isoform X1 [Biomphalaria glabrata]|uniref:Uncharacterized protein LOC106078018 isoform X1 n=2 Tax=Biomphalaria glabrata TaxID=6526 RepID=A0A9W3AR87_BIOGL|nr:uncharacterized protein LOC106078018 isoform X1 [Biomphalaria glabrata]